MSSIQWREHVHLLAAGLLGSLRTHTGLGFGVQDHPGEDPTTERGWETQILLNMVGWLFPDFTQN